MVRLSDRVGGSGEQDQPIEHAPTRSLATLGQAMRLTTVVDPLADLRDAAADELFARLGSRLTDPSLDEATLRDYARAELLTIIDASRTPLTSSERQRLLREVEDDVLGLGILEPLLGDPSITEIMVNGPKDVYVERSGYLTRADVAFHDEKQLRRVIDRIVSRVGRRIDEASPMVDARLADGSRVNAIIAPLAVSGSTLTIRKFAAEALKVQDLINIGTLSHQLAMVLDLCVRARLNILVSGGTGTGKTTMLNVLSSSIPDSERIITVEDAVELQLQQQHIVRLESRPANTEGKGEITIRDLVKNALRMRPDRIVVGEVRGAEALDMLQAMNTGHDGSLSTVHANTARDAMARLETLVLMAGMDLPLRAIREQVASAIDLVVHIARLRDGSRRVVAIAEMEGLDGDILSLQDIFRFDYSAGLDANGRHRGVIAPTGVRPKFADRFDDLGIAYDTSMFRGRPL